MSDHYLVTGAGRGIGLALVKHLLTRKHKVWATYRTAERAVELLRLADQHNDLEIAQLDVTNDDAIAQLQRTWSQVPFHVLINNAGFYGPKGVRFGVLDRDVWQQVLSVNTIAPYQITAAFYPNLVRPGNAKVIFLSSKVGSIEDNQSGGGYYYRSSKTALNQIVKSLSIDLKSEGFTVLALHPGWVQTEMGGPNAIIAPDVSAEGLLSVIELADVSYSGGFFNYDGTRIPW